MEELEEEKGFVVRQTGLHLPGRTVRKYEESTIYLQNRIDACKKKLSTGMVYDLSWGRFLGSKKPLVFILFHC